MDMTRYVGGLFLKVDDLKATKPVRVRIVDVREGKYEKPDLTFDDGRKLSVNASNGRTLARAYGYQSDWLGKEIELAVGELEYQGKTQKAILVTPISPANTPDPDDDMHDEIAF